MPCGQNCDIGLLRGESAEGDGSVDDKTSNGEHASNSAAVKFRPDMSQGIFQQDEALVHTAAKSKRTTQKSGQLPWLLGEGYIILQQPRPTAHRKPVGDHPGQGRQEEPGDVKSL